MSRQGRLVVLAVVCTVVSLLGINGTALGANTTVEFSLVTDGFVQGLFQQLVDKYEAAHPGIDIKMTVYAWGDYYAKLPVMASSNLLPDIFYLNGYLANEWHAQGISLDLTPLIERDKFNVKDLWEAEIPEMSYGGRLHALPYDLTIVGMFWNRDMFNELGLAPPTKNWTWDDVLQAGKKMVRIDGGQQTRWGLQNTSFAGTFSQGNLLGYGARYLAADGQASAINSPEAVAYYNTVKGFNDANVLVNKAAGGPGGPFFINGKAGMFIEQSWAPVSPLRPQARFDWDVTYMPRGPQGRYVSATGGQWCINPKSKNIEASWEFLKYLSSTEANNFLISDYLFSMPGRKSAIPRWLSVAKNGNLPPAHAEILTEMLANDAVPVPVTPVLSKMNSVISKYAWPMVYGDRAISDGLTNMDREFSQLLADYRAQGAAKK